MVKKQSKKKNIPELLADLVIELRVVGAELKRMRGVWERAGGKEHVRTED